MKKDTVLNTISQNPAVAVIRADDADSAIQIADACIAGGIQTVEITYTIPHANYVIETLCKKYTEQGILIGAGTVIDAETARNAILAGAAFLVSPTTDVKMLELCNRYRVMSVAGAFTPNEVKVALEAGADLIKIFPATLCEPSYLKVLHGPFPQAAFMVTGSMTFDTAKEWLRCGATAIGVGGLLTDPAKVGNYEKITENARTLLKALT